MNALTLIFYFFLFCILLFLIHYLYRLSFIANFNTKYVFITGTDTGFGKQLAIKLDKIGVHVYAGCYTTEGADNLRSKTSDRLKTIILDITDQRSVDDAKEFVEKDLPPGKCLWGLVNNAGISGNNCFQLSNLEDYRKVMEVNFFGQIRVTEAFLPLIKNSKGRIVNMISLAGRVSLDMPAYSATKFALEPYNDGLRRALKPCGVKVVCIEPNMTGGTNILGEHFWVEMKKKWDVAPQSTKDELGKNYLENLRAILDTIYSHTHWLDLIDKKGIADIMVHALGANHPKDRYVCGVASRLMICGVNFMPDWLLDFFIVLFWRVMAFVANVD